MAKKFKKTKNALASTGPKMSPSEMSRMRMKQMMKPMPMKGKKPMMDM